MSDFTARAKQKAEAMAKKAAAERQQEMLKRRMEYAKEGALFYKAQKYKDASERYLKYLAIVEEWKGARPGMLHPSMFDPKKDAGEMILMAGIFWDMAKLYDRAKQRSAGRDPLKDYLNLYVMFSKGMPYQSMCAETIRKYLMNEKAVNRGAFKDAYMALGGGRCFVVSTVGEFLDPAVLAIYRNFRDDTLGESKFGRILISAYYFLGPSAGRLVRLLPLFMQKKFAQLLEKSARKYFT